MFHDMPHDMVRHWLVTSPSPVHDMVRHWLVTSPSPVHDISRHRSIHGLSLTRHRFVIGDDMLDGVLKIMPHAAPSQTLIARGLH
jgi:hypothetical protein